MKRILSRSCHGLPKWGLIWFPFSELYCPVSRTTQLQQDDDLLQTWSKRDNKERFQGCCLPSHLYCRLIPLTIPHAELSSFRETSSELAPICYSTVLFEQWCLNLNSRLQMNIRKILEVQLHITIWTRATWMKGSLRNYHGWKCCDLQLVWVKTETVCKVPNQQILACLLMTIVTTLSSKLYFGCIGELDQKPLNGYGGGGGNEVLAGREIGNKTLQTAARYPLYKRAIPNERRLLGITR